MMMMPMNTHLLNKAPSNLVNRVTSLTNSMQQVITSLAVSTLVTILTARTTARGTEMQEAAAAAGQSAAGASQEALLLAKQTVLSQGFADTFHIMMFVALGGAVLGLLLRRGRKSEGEPTKEQAVPEIMHG
ncbi:hypothetical protein KDC22_14665 [Paenibacillus tritici]|uniref:hypothetical protein n=1 Tax=Paenibacillus tritici TaxID=1873425 RepID=UPI001BA76362|nr:hypothetical protein [Paenibacillus tritici]QUL57609.1 hypothetical protein KDC22_14665 [Paenibacillus tritici]